MPVELMEDYEVLEESARNLQAKARLHPNLSIKTKNTLGVMFEAFLKRVRMALVEAGELPTP